MAAVTTREMRSGDTEAGAAVFAAVLLVDFPLVGSGRGSPHRSPADDEVWFRPGHGAEYSAANRHDVRGEEGAPAVEGYGSAVKQSPRVASVPGRDVQMS